MRRGSKAILFLLYGLAEERYGNRPIAPFGFFAGAGMNPS